MSQHRSVEPGPDADLAAELLGWLDVRGAVGDTRVIVLADALMRAALTPYFSAGDEETPPTSPQEAVVEIHLALDALREVDPGLAEILEDVENWFIHRVA
jgi:hypothetical protein